CSKNKLTVAHTMIIAHNTQISSLATIVPSSIKSLPFIFLICSLILTIIIILVSIFLKINCHSFSELVFLLLQGYKQGGNFYETKDWFDTRTIALFNFLLCPKYYRFR